MYHEFGAPGKNFTSAEPAGSRDEKHDVIRREELGKSCWLQRLVRRNWFFFYSAELKLVRVLKVGSFRKVFGSITSRYKRVLNDVLLTRLKLFCSYIFLKPFPLVFCLEQKSSESSSFGVAENLPVEV